jgi:hypothetical protein
VGALGWWHTNIVSAPAYSQVAGSWPNLGILKVTTAATHGAGFEFKPGSTSPFGALGANTSWALTFVFRAGQAANQRLRVGVFPNAVATAEPTSGMWMRCDTSSGFGDANWKFETRSSSVSTVTDTGAACDTDWHTLRIYSTASGSVTFKLDSGAGGRTSTITQTLPSGGLTAGAILVVDQSSGATAKYVDIDKISFKATGLSR